MHRPKSARAYVRESLHGGEWNDCVRSILHLSAYLKTEIYPICTLIPDTIFLQCDDSRSKQLAWITSDIPKDEASLVHDLLHTPANLLQLSRV